MKRIVAGFLLLALVSLGPPAAAQTLGDPGLDQLQVELRIEVLEAMVESVAGRLQNAGEEAKAASVRGREVTESFASQHIDIEPQTALEALYKSELEAGLLSETDLKVDRNLFRALQRGFRIRAIPAGQLPAGPTGYNPPRTQGYLPEVAAVDNAAPHSMHDLHDYLINRFTKAALNRIVSEGYHVELHVGTQVEAFADLTNRGFEILGEVVSATGNYERLVVAQSPSGEIRFVITGTVSGIDRVRHLSLLLRFAGPNGEGLPADRLTIVGDVEALKERNYRTLREGLERLGGRGTTALIGFRARWRAELTERALARRGAEHLRDVLGADPYAGLKERLAAEAQQATGQAKQKLEAVLSEVESSSVLNKGLSVDPAEAFGQVKQLKTLQRAEKLLVELNGKANSTVLDGLVADGKLRLPGGVSMKDHSVARAMESGFLKADELRAMTPEGPQRVRLVNNYYGDAMGDVVRALLDSGHQRLAYFGTAGGTGEGVRVGDIHVPKDIYDWKNELTSSGVRNGFLDYFEGTESSLSGRLKLGTKLGNVFSPAVETQAWLEDVKARGLQAIEVENSYIAQEVTRYNAEAPAEARASLHTAVIVSDVPGSEHTLGNHNGATTDTFDKMVDHYLEALGIQDLEVFPKEDAKPSARPLARDAETERRLGIADRLVPNNPEKATFFRDRVAGILGSVDAQVLSALSGEGALQPSEIPGLSEEVRAELEAELADPYTDAKLVEKLVEAEALVTRLANRLVAQHPDAAFEFRLGGGIEHGQFSPARGLSLEVVGPSEVKASAATLLPELAATLPQAPKVTLGGVGEVGLTLTSKALTNDPNPIQRENASRALAERGVHLQGKRAQYQGFEHDPTVDPTALFSRFESHQVGPEATEELLRSFRRKVAARGGRIDYVRSVDPRLRGGQARTLLDASGETVVLLPSDRPVRRYALIDELTHVLQLDRARRSIGPDKLLTLFAEAQAGDPVAVRQLIAWELDAKRKVRLMLPSDSPDRGLLDREVQALRRALDPYESVRTADGKINWGRVGSAARHHAEGSASFLLGLFLKELTVVVQSGDRHAVEAFFDGLATTEFWTHYGGFVVGAEVGTAAYGKFLQRYIKPGFVNNVLKSNVALATGMALPMVLHGQFHGETFAINLAGLALSSTAVTATLHGLRFVKPLGALERYRGVATVLRLTRGVPGWVYGGVQTAVVLYFAEVASARISGWLDERRARDAVEEAAQGLLRAASAARHADDPALREALESSVVAYTAWRDRSLRPALEASARLQEAMQHAGREAARLHVGEGPFRAIAGRYPGVDDSLARLTARQEQGLQDDLARAVERFGRQRSEGLRVAYEENRRERDYAPTRRPRDVSDNRPQAYADEAALYEAAADAAEAGGRTDVALRLRDWAAITREAAERERALFTPEMRGVVDVLRHQEGAR